MPAPELYQRVRAALEALLQERGRGSVSDAHGLAVIETEPPATDRPVLYLVPLRETAPASPFTDARQTITVEFAVLLALDARNVRRGRATDAADAGMIDASLRAAEELRAEVIGAVRGVSPGAPFSANRLVDTYSDVQYAGGRLLDIGPGVLWHQLDFRTAYLED